jgi:hypothetical protein
MALGPILDCACLENCDAGTIDRLARLQLAARRNGFSLELTNVDQALRELIEFCGVAAVLGVESEGQSEQGEQPGSVEEEGELGDPTLG